MKMSEIAATLRAIGVSPVKSLGQNFLHDRNLAKWIVDQASIGSKDFVIEIGPGLGALTELALANAAGVLAIEKDKRLAEYLRDRFRSSALEIVHGDAMEFDARMLYTKPTVKFLGNLPYYISSQLLMKFLEYPSPISLWLFMLQKELAKRLVAAPTTSDYGVLTLLVQLQHRVEYLRKVPSSVFLPKPEVDSALVRISERDPRELPACDHKAFQKLVRRGFSQRRKQLGKLIREELPDWENKAVELGLNTRARAEEPREGHRRAGVAPRDSAQDSASPVDEEDRLKGTALRSKVHANNFLHRAVHVLIFNPAGEVFLQMRSRWKDRHPLAWDSSAAGHVNAGEDYDQAASRELREELGVDIPLVRVAKLPASERTGYEFICLYRGSHAGELRLNPSEIEAGRFFPPTIVDDWMTARPRDFAPGFVECWKIGREKNP